MHGPILIINSPDVLIIKHLDVFDLNHVVVVDDYSIERNSIETIRDYAEGLKEYSIENSVGTSLYILEYDTYPWLKGTKIVYPKVVLVEKAVPGYVKQVFRPPKNSVLRIVSENSKALHREGF